MSFNPSNNYSFSTDKGTVTTAIGEVAAGVKGLLNYSSGTRFKNCSAVNTWTVRGLKSLGSGTTSIESVPFTHQNSSTWCMVLTKNTTGLNLSFMLKNSESEMPLGAKVKADEVLRSGEKREVYPRTWCTLKQGQKSQMLPFRKIVTAGGTVNEDEITLQCEVCMQCIVQDELLVGEMAEPKVGLFRCLEEMLHKEVHTDFELRAGGTVMKAHKALLAVRSPYFAAMLQPHTKEAQEGFVEVSDVKPEVLRQVLVYVYTAEAPGLKDKPWELLMAADKYQLPQLKRQCEAYIASRLDVDNAAETAANAFVFSSDLLLQRAVHFIKRNLSQVISTPGWNEAIAAYPEAIQRISEMIE